MQLLRRSRANGSYVRALSVAQTGGYENAVDPEGFCGAEPTRHWIAGFACNARHV